MVNKCIVPKCRTGCQKKSPPGVSVHKFPLKNPQICAEWAKAIGKPRDWKPGVNSLVCSLHFLPSDFSLFRTDVNAWRRKNKCSVLKYRQLLPSAVPTVLTFPNCNNLRLYTSLKDIRDELQELGDSSLPKDIFLTSRGSQSLHFLKLTFHKSAPKLHYALNVFDDLSYSMTVGDMPIQEGLSQSPQSRITSLGALKDALNIVKAHAESEVRLQDLDTTLLRIRRSVAALPESDRRKSKILFLLEQLNTALHSDDKEYSESLIKLGVLWNKASPQFYGALSMSSQAVLSLPNTSFLRNHSENLLCRLQNRYASVSSNAGKLVSLFVKELVSCESSSTFSDGKYLRDGHWEYALDICVKLMFDGKNEQEVHKYVPIDKLDPFKIKNEVFEAIRTCTRVGFKVISLILDVGTSFHDFYTQELFKEGDESNATTSRFILNPFDSDPESRIFVIFSPSGCLQSLLDHWVEHYKLTVPPFKGQSDWMCPEINKIEHILQIGALSNHQRRVTLRVVPNVFNDSNLTSLKKGPTFEFIKIVLKFHKLMMQELDDDTTGAIDSQSDSRIQFLVDFNTWISEWFLKNEELGHPTDKLYRELTVTASGTADIISHLLDCDNGLELYSGCFAVESEQGDLSWDVSPFCHRSLVGLDIVLANRKKIIDPKVLASLMGSRMENLDYIFSESSELKEEEKTLSFSLDISHGEDLHFQTSRENDVLYILSAFASESLLMSLGDEGCQSCCRFLVDLENPPVISFEDSTHEIRSIFSQAVSQRGMSCPSDLLYSSCLIIRKLYLSLKEIISRNTKQRHSVDLFFRAVEAEMRTSEEMERMLLLSCDFGHPYLPLFRSLCGRLYRVFSFGRKRKVLSVMSVGPEPQESSDVEEELIHEALPNISDKPNSEAAIIFEETVPSVFL